MKNTRNFNGGKIFSIFEYACFHNGKTKRHITLIKITVTLHDVIPDGYNKGTSMFSFQMGTMEQQSFPQSSGYKVPSVIFEIGWMYLKVSLTFQI